MIEPARAMQSLPQILFAGPQCMLNYCLQECCQTFQEHDHALRYASFLTLRRRRLAGQAVKLPALRRLLLPLLLGGVLQPALPAHAAAAEDAPPLLLAQNFNDAVDPAAYLVSDAQRRAPPPVGSVVTYRYRERTPNGLPRFASFMRVHAPE